MSASRQEGTLRQLLPWACFSIISDSYESEIVNALTMKADHFVGADQIDLANQARFARSCIHSAAATTSR